MEILYLIVAYNLPSQLIRLVKTLNSKDVFFMIHFDKKAKKQDFSKIKKELKNYSNVFFTKKRHKCFWGEFGIIKATIQMIRESLQRKIPFDYAILLSGQTYPIKSNNYIKTFLEKNKEKFFLFGEKMPTSFWDSYAQQRIEKWHFRFLGKRFSFPSENFPFILKRKFLRGFEPCGGSTWWCFSKEVIIYINKCLKINKKFLKFFKYVQVPDEIIFQTLLINSNYNKRRINGNLLFEIWLENPTKPGSPEILKKKDFETIKNSDKLFARKFDTRVDSEILDTIDKELLNKN